MHAGIDIAPSQRPKLERLCRYVSRPPVATARMALTSSGHVRYALKTPYRDGTTHIVIEPLDFMARLAGLVPPPRMHLMRYHGVLTPRRANPNARDALGSTPLTSVAVGGVGRSEIERERDKSAAKLLVSAGADLRARTNAGVSAADVARKLHKTCLLPILGF